MVPHLEKLRVLDIEVQEVRTSGELKTVEALILPGGESTSMIHLAKQSDLWAELKAFVTKKPTWGICAGAILLAKQVTHPKQDSLAAIDVTIERNAFGRQSDSFIDAIELANGEVVEAVFIRAPRLISIGKGVSVLGKWKGEAVLVEEGLCRISTFHPELTDFLNLHQDFIKKCQGTTK